MFVLEADDVIVFIQYDRKVLQLMINMHLEEVKQEAPRSELVP